MKPNALHLAVLISGNGSNLQAIIDACRHESFPAEIKVVISSHPDAYGLERAKQAGIPTLGLNYKAFATREDFESVIQKELTPYHIDLICLAGFMRVLTPSFISQWPHKIINTHPSLLPKFGGHGMYGIKVHKAVIKAREEVSGSTIHYVIPDVDKGEIVLQKQVPVHPEDTPEDLAARVIEQEHIAYPEAIKKIAREKGLI